MTCPTCAAQNGFCANCLNQSHQANVSAYQLNQLNQAQANQGNQCTCQQAFYGMPRCPVHSQTPNPYSQAQQANQNLQNHGFAGWLPTRQLVDCECCGEKFQDEASFFGINRSLTVSLNGLLFCGDCKKITEDESYQKQLKDFALETLKKYVKNKAFL